MDAAGWARLKEWFGLATEAAPEDRPKILADAERESPILAAELRSLLKEHSLQRLSTTAVMAQKPRGVERHPADAPAGGEIGPYRILSELGRGGTGVVFLAERRDDEFHRRVALKVLRYAEWDQRTQGQLTLERRILSQLQHPNIAALVDWGDTPDGVPWLATEYVEGEPVDRYCRTRGFGVADTLNLFDQICQAVQYAHQRLVVHRDLKPANILVTDAGLVKLLDFGISKPLDDGTVTSAVDRRFTPAYASPEQIKGEPVTAATDVYTLGLLLYELLTGVLPHATGSVEDLTRRLDDREPVAPSAVPGQPASWQRALRGDVDRIVLHCLERAPERRYQSVEQLRADIGRYRSGHPIAARRPSAVYRAGKFVRRHALPLAAAALAISALIVGTVVAVSNARLARQEQERAEKRFKEVQSLAHSVIWDLHDEIRRVPQSTSARRLLAETAVKYLDGLAAENSTDDALQMEVAAGYIRMGYALGGLAGVNVGDTNGSRHSYRTALNILEEQARRRPGDLQAAVARYAAAYNLSMMLNDPAEGLAMARRYGAGADAWVAREPMAVSWQAVELLYSAAGRILRNMRRYDESLAAFDRAEAAQQRMIATASTKNAPQPMFSITVEYQQAIFDTGLTAYARTETLLDMGRAADALRSIERARALFAESSSLSKNGPSDVRMFPRTRSLQALTLLRLGRLDEAWTEINVALTAGTANMIDGSATGQRDLAETHRHAGAILLARGDLPAALEQLRLSTDVIGKLAETDGAFLVNRVLHAAMLIDYGEALTKARQASPARAAFEKSVSILNTAISEAPSWAALPPSLARATAGLHQLTRD